MSRPARAGLGPSWWCWSVAVAALLSSGCASVPLASPEEDARVRQLQPAEGRALLYVFRDSGMAALNAFPIFVDGERICDLASGTFAAADVAPGEHRVEFPFNDGATSLPVRLAAGQRAYVRQWLERIPAVLVMVERAKLTEVPPEEGQPALGRLARFAVLERRAAEDRSAWEAPVPAGQARVVLFRWSWAAQAAEFRLEVGGGPPVALPVRSFTVADVPAGQVVVTAHGANDASLPLQLEAGAVAWIAVIPRMGLTSPRVELERIDEGRGRSSVAALHLVAPAGR